MSANPSTSPTLSCAVPVSVPDNPALARAGELIAQGRLVAFPTETVYGLGGDATNDDAVAGIFAAKGRPTFNPLIVHFSNGEAAKSAVIFNDKAQKLADAFWPGALTLILTRKENCPISRLVSAGLETIAVRVPAHDVAQALLKEAGCPLAAPSANRSGKVSPTKASHVVEEFSEQSLAMILDGGACTLGLESTVVDMTGQTPILLRPGSLESREIEAVIGPLETLEDAGTEEKDIKSPGRLLSHYAPAKPLRLNVEEVKSGEALLAFGPHDFEGCVAQRNLSPRGDVKEAAANLFAYLRELDETDAEAIAVMTIPRGGLGLAINDRLTRASAPRDGDATP